MIKACSIRENSTVLRLNATLNIVFLLLDKQTKINYLFMIGVSEVSYSVSHTSSINIGLPLGNSEKLKG